MTNLKNTPREIKVIQGTVYGEALMGQIADSHSLPRI
jgi:hypothetical protein